MKTRMLLEMATVKRLPAMFAIAAMSAIGCAGQSDTPDSGADAGADAGAFNPVALVNPMIGTSGANIWGVGSTLPGALAPSGLVKVSPDTLNDEGNLFNQHCAGYFYRDPYITGFSQVHFYGTGVPDYAVLGIIPSPVKDRDRTTLGAYRLTYDKGSEHSEAGYYRVVLEKGIVAELTASERVALHRYTFPDGYAGDRCIIADMGHTVPLTLINTARLSIDPASGSFSAGANAWGGLTLGFGGYDIFFKGAIDPPPDYTGVWGDNGRVADGVTSCPGTGGRCGALLCWNTAKSVEIRVGVSYVSVAGARANFEAEVSGRTFEDVVSETREKWRRKLARIVVTEPGPMLDVVVFYTALYHLFQMPTIQSDVTGSYMGFDRKAHKTDWDGPYYSDFSLWDTYRTQHPFFTLFYRGEQRDMALSLLQMARLGGYFPKWAAANGETNCMVGTPADIVIADSYLKGIEFPAAESFDYLMKSALYPTAPDSGYIGREGIEDYLSLGYLPKSYKGSVAKTQEYSYADEALCNMATALGRSEKDSLCATRYNHRNLWSKSKSFFLARARDGSFPGEETFDPETVSSDCLDPSNSDYVEGNAWQYRWFAPHDTGWMIERFGGADAFVDALQSFYEKAMAEEAKLVRGTEPWGASRKYYWHGNEPNIHDAWLFSAAGRPDLTCKYVRWIMSANYINTPDGLSGNDDAGTMSAWYLFSALGFYPIPGADRYLLGCPAVRHATLDIGGNQLVISTVGSMDEGSRPVSFFFNGTELSKPEITWQELKNGGTLTFYMGM